MAEWSIAAVLKTVELRGSGGSNPSLSASDQRFCRLAFKRVFFLWLNDTRKLICRYPLVIKNIGFSDNRKIFGLLIKEYRDRRPQGANPSHNSFQVLPVGEIVG